MSNAQSADQNPQSSNNLSANPISSSKAEDGQKIATDDKLPSNLEEFLLAYPDFCKGRLLAMQAIIKNEGFAQLPIIYGPDRKPIWINRAQRRKLRP